MSGPPMPAPDMSSVDPGLQPLLITLLYLFPGLALSVLCVRLWKKWKEHNLGGGMNVVEYWKISQERD